MVCFKQCGQRGKMGDMASPAVGLMSFSPYSVRIPLGQARFGGLKKLEGRSFHFQFAIYPIARRSSAMLKSRLEKLQDYARSDVSWP